MPGHAVALLVPIVLACCAAAAAAAPTLLGAYLGCFDVNKDGWIQKTTDYSRVKTLSGATIAQCRSQCSKSFYSLAIVTRDFRCRCSMRLPDESHRWPDAKCLPAVTGANAGKGQPAAVYYLHKAAASTMCRLANVPFTANSWKVAYSPECVALPLQNLRGNVDFGNGEMKMRLQGTTGSRLTTNDKDQLYGQWQVTAKVSGAPGAVTAFYARSNDVYPNEMAGGFSEIDIEWLNGNPAKEAGSLWFNAFTNGKGMGERMIPPSQYQKQLGYPKGKTAANSYITYTVNWQPDFVSWAIDGKHLRTMKNGDSNTWYDMKGKKFSATFKSPSKPSHATISMWTDVARGKAPADMFGGALNPSKGPYYSYFKQFRRVVCDKPLPKDMSALGPQWLTAVLH